MGSKDEMGIVQINVSSGNRQIKETTWATALGNDLYQIKGPLHLISGLNSQDIVQAVTLPGESFPTVKKVVSKSGYKTLHILFRDNVPILDQQKLLTVLGEWNAIFEKPFDLFYTIEVKPRGDYQAVSDYFESLRLQGLIFYEPNISIDSLLRLRFVK